MSVPPAFIALATLIKEFSEKEENQPTGYTSETLSGVYSYTKAGGKGGAGLTWQAAFAERLNPWRKAQ